MLYNNSLHYLPLAMARFVDTPMITTLHTPPLPWLESAVALAPHGSTFISVSESTRRSWEPVVASAVVHNGIDTDDWSPVPDPDRVRELGVDPDRPAVIFVGRITRQKGLPLFLRAAAQLPPDVQLVLCAGAPDTPEIEAEVRGLVDGLAAERSGVVWIGEMLPRPDVVALLTAATVFVCPSIYEPLGIVNLEAMACETAVVATATGGIPEVVVHGETGWLVPIEQAQDGTGTPLDPEKYVADLAAALVDAASDPDRAAAYGRAGRARAKESFSGPAIAERTLEVYRSLG